MRLLPLGIKNERRLKSLTGLKYETYELLLKEFTQVYDNYEQVKQQEKAEAKQRKRQPGGGRKPALPSIEIKLLFLLYYLKAYPTFDLLGDRFEMASSTANIQLHRLMPLLESALNNLGVMPKRSFSTPQEFQDYITSLGGVTEILIDVTEREYFRYQDTEKRDALFSGKKKDLPLKIQ